MTKRYRPNVAAIIQNRSGLVLIGRRSDFASSWQFPQGGVDAGESAEAAVRREIFEEVALSPDLYNIAEQRGPYCYDYPGGVVHRGFHGQEQIYFLCRIRAEGIPLIKLEHSCGEFSEVRWVAVRDVPVDLVPPMKQGVYRRVLRDFFGEMVKFD